MMIRSLASVGIFCFTVQFITATWFVTYFETPNISTQIAWNILETRRYAGGSPKLKGFSKEYTPDQFRRYQLPGEPLYLASAFRLLPASLHRYVHLPVTVLLVTSVASVACWIEGPALALVAGILASLQPFVALHGPVWDDTFLAAALVWFAIALLFRRLQGSAGGAKAVPPFPASLSILWLAAVWAALTRAEAQVILLLIAGACLLIPAMRGLRWEGAALGLGVILALGAWGIRNKLLLGEFTIGSSHDGITLWESNGPYTREALRHGTAESTAFNAERMKVHWDRTASMTENEMNKYYMQQGVQYILKHPVAATRTSLLKLFLSLTGISMDKPLTSARNLVSIASSTAAFALGLYGLRLWKRRISRSTYPLECCLFVALTAPVFAVLLLGPIGLRYRIAWDGILWIAGSAAILHGWARGAPGRASLP